FEIPAQLRSAWNALPGGEAAEAQWRRRMDAYRQGYPEQGGELERRLRGELPAAFPEQADALMNTLAREAPADATRKHSARVLTELAACLPELLGGSADLTGSNNTDWDGAAVLGAEPAGAAPRGRYLHYGVREFGMA